MTQTQEQRDTKMEEGGRRHIEAKGRETLREALVRELHRRSLLRGRWAYREAMFAHKALTDAIEAGSIDDDANGLMPSMVRVIECDHTRDLHVIPNVRCPVCRVVFERL